MAYGSLYARQSMSTCERTFADPRALTMRQDTLASFLRGPIYFGVLSDERGSEGRGKMERTSEIQQRLAPLVPRCERVSSASSIPPPERHAWCLAHICGLKWCTAKRMVKCTACCGRQTKGAGVRFLLATWCKAKRMVKRTACCARHANSTAV